MRFLLHRRWCLVGLAVLVMSGLMAAALYAQFRGRRGPRRPFNREEYPRWENHPDFEHDVFTFARVEYEGRASVVDGHWANDYPDADLNFSFRLQQLTSLKVDPNGKVLRLNDPHLFDYPFLFMIGIRDLEFHEQEVEALRRYLLNGGFLMVDDFWAPEEWHHIRSEMRRVFPDREPRELPHSHPIFHLVYDLPELPQVPSINAWSRGWDFEYWHGDPGNDKGPHFMGYFDDRQRLVALLCHNNDICDGWEREGENTEYFERFSERWSYPLGINILTYAMTH
ncbi:MAG: DUF4159 domain-containing protein [Pirellulaceae bacterium]